MKLPRHKLVPGTGHDCPPEYFNYKDDDPALYAKAALAVLERRIGHGTAVYEHMGYDRPAENALLDWLAKMLKGPAMADRWVAGCEVVHLVNEWRDELIDNLDRDQVEDEAAKMDTGDDE